MTLDEWVNANASALRDDIKCHIDQTSLPEDEKGFLLRMIMISIRWERK